MSELICLIAQRLAELDGKVWSELNVPQQWSYVPAALMAADAAAQVFAARGMPVYEDLAMPKVAAMTTGLPSANLLPAE